MRREPVAREQVAGARAVVTHADGNIDGRAHEGRRQCPRDVRTEFDRPTLAVDPDSDPAVAETIKPEKHAVSMQLALRRRADQAGRRGTIAIGLKV